MKPALPIVSIVGKGSSGRTSVLEGLIAELTARGYRVATAKHHAHETDIDVPGKDSYRHAAAGSVLSMVSAPNRVGSFLKVDGERSLEELADKAAREARADILLTEGFKRVSPVLIEVVRAERSTEPICSPKDLFALVTDVKGLEAEGLPRFALDDSEALANLIEHRFLSERREGVRPAHALVYMDHGATSWPKPQEVVEAVHGALTELAGNPGRGAHGPALAASRAVFQARRACAHLLGVADPKDLVFQPGCTQACNLMLHGLLVPGDRVVVGSMEHNAVVRPLATLAARGVEVVVVRADSSGLVDPGEVEREVRARRTRAVVCQHASNVTGTVQLIEEMAEVAHENGALLLVDGAQAAGHLEVDLSSMGADAYAVSGHKGMLGPQGVGLLYLSPGLEAKELVTGGSAAGDSSLPEMPQERPHRYEAGTPNTSGIVGLGAAAALLSSRGSSMREHAAGLACKLHEGLQAIPNLRVLGPALAEPRVPLLSVVHSHVEADRLAFLLDSRHGIAARAGLHCAPWAHETLGTSRRGTLRLGVGHETAEEEIDLVLGALAEAVSEV
ncbi:MAG: molybdopterin-guanine dinucleotide biosynthesis protein B [Myxococcota bacterium]